MTILNIPKMAALAAAATLAAVAFAAGPANAEPSVFRIIYKKCTTLNCNADQIRGSISSYGVEPNPWNGQFMLQANKCARFDFLSANEDIEATLVAPSGAVYSDDDSGLGLNPLLGVANVPSHGVYTLIVNHFAGTSIETGFVLAAAQYNVGNPNCVNTTPRVASDR